MLIIILFLLTVFAINKKYNKKFNSYQNIDLIPKIIKEEEIKSFYIEKNQFYILVENTYKNTQLLRVYDLKTGKFLYKVKLR